MLDVVANHVGPLDNLGDVKHLGAPFNDTSGTMFHSLNRSEEESFAQYIDHPVAAFSTGCFPGNYSCPTYNETIMRDGWFGDLGDISQENPVAGNFLEEWIHRMVTKYDLDGLRLDTAIYMPKSFLKRFQDSAGVLILGEATAFNVTFHSSYQHQLTGLLNFPLTMTLGRIFNKTGGSFESLPVLAREYAAANYTDVNLLGNFIDNHDGARFLYSRHGDVGMLRHALVWLMFRQGIPIVYYGTEDPRVSNQVDGRTSMWPYFDTSNELYGLLAQLNSIRKAFGLSHGGVYATKGSQLLHATKDALAYSRGELLVVVGNMQAKTVQLCVPIMTLPESLRAAACSAGWHDVLTSTAIKPDCVFENVCVGLDMHRPYVLASTHMHV